MLYCLLFIFCCLFNNISSQANNLTPNKNHNFFKATLDYNKKAYIYFIETPTENNKTRAWQTFESSAFKFPILLKHATSKKRPVILVMPANYQKSNTISSEAPWIEGSRVALAWASSYFRFKQLGNTDVRVILYNSGDNITPKLLTKIISKNIEYNTSVSPEINMQQRLFNIKNILGDNTNSSHISKHNNILLKPYNIKQEEPKINLIKSKLEQTQENQKRILITGGAGFVGSHIAIELINQGHQVIVLDNLLCSSLENLDKIKENKNFEFHKIDVSEPFDITCNVDMVLHLASAPSPMFYYNKPYETLLAGLNGTKNSIELAIKKNARFLFTSTSEVYGDPEISPQPEDYIGNVSPIGKRCQYDQSKRGAETLLSLYYQKYNHDIRIIRIFNTYGPHMNLQDGRVVTNFIQALLTNSALPVYGTGTQTRSFAYVSDTVTGILKVLWSNDITGFKSLQERIFNVGNPGEFTIKELALKTNLLSEKYLNKPALIEYQEQPDPDDPKVRKPDISKIKNLLNFNPEISLDKGLEETLTYFLNKLGKQNKSYKCEEQNNYISRWEFQNACDFVFDPSTHDFLKSTDTGITFDPSLVKHGDKVFVRRDCLKEFFNTLHTNINNKYILVTHVDDTGIDQDSVEYLQDEKIISWFGINPEVKINIYNKLNIIPIGVSQLKEIDKQKEEINNLFSTLRNTAIKNKLLYLNFTDSSHEERAYVRSLFQDKSFCTNAKQKEFNEYLKEMAQHKFVLSPRGIGLDCYRTWESLLVGSIPIVKTSYLDPVYQDLPVVIINDWQEVTKEFLEQKYIEISSKKYNLEKLYIGYWIKQIRLNKS